MTSMQLGPSRRKILLACGAAVSSVGLPASAAPARNTAQNYDWLSVIKQHHVQIADTFERLLRARGPQRAIELRMLDQILKGHQLAEQNVIYPAMARAGLVDGAERLYMQEAHAKIDLSTLELMSGAHGEGEWMDLARKLQREVMTHALDDEEKQLYPKLKEKLDAEEDRRLGILYPREFARVLPPQQR